MKKILCIALIFFAVPAYAMQRNVAGQEICADLISVSDGSDVTGGTTTVTVTGDGTTASGEGTVSHKTGSLWCYYPTQAETDVNHFTATFSNAAAVTRSPQTYTARDISGSGDTAVDENTGGADNLRYVYQNQGIDGATIKVYLKTDYDSGNRAEAYVKARSITKTDGRWQWPVYLDSGFTYTIVFYKQGQYGPSTAEITLP